MVQRIRLREDATLSAGGRLIEVFESNKPPARSLHGHLVHLAVLLLLPALLIGAWLTAEVAHRLRSDLEGLLAGEARAAAAAVGRELQAAVVMLETLGTSPHLDAGADGLAAFHAQSRMAVAPLGSFVILTLPEDPMRQVANSRLPFGANLPNNLPEGPAAVALRTGFTAFLPPVSLPGIEQVFAGVAVPVRREAHGMIAALAMPLPAARLGPLLRQSERATSSSAFILAAPTSSVVSLSTRGDVLPRMPARVILDLAGDQQRGILRRADAPAGDPALIAFERVPLSGWIVALGMTREEELTAWLRPAVTSATLILVVVLMLGLIAVATIIRLIRPLDGLTSESGALPLGTVRIAEFEALAVAVAEARSAPLREAENARRTAAEHLRLARDAEDERQLLRSIILSVPDGIFVKDAALRYVVANPALVRLMGRSEAEILHAMDEELLAPDVARQVREADQHTINTGEVQEYETSMILPGHPDEARIYALVKAPWRDAAGRIVGLVGVARDVTERRAAEGRMHGAEQAMQRIARADVLAAMSLGVAHELNQPLTAAGNFLRAGIRWLSPAPPSVLAIAAAREAMQEAAAQTLRAGEILRRLRDFINRGETEQRLVSLGPLVANGVALVSAGRGAQAPRITLDLAISGCLVMADEVQMQQVFVNLLRNAIEATEGVPERGISVTLCRQGGQAVLRFADAGPGLPEEVVDRLFQPFVTTKATGMGIGLSICRTIIEAHGGRITAEEGAGGGTVMTIRLPLARAALAA